MPNQTLPERLRRAWNAFTNRDPTQEYSQDYGPGFYYRPDKFRYSHGNEKSIINAIYTRIAVDVAAINIQHVRLDDNDRFTEEIEDGLDNILTLEANIDQTNRNFIQDIVMSMCNEGVVAVVPVDTTTDPTGRSEAYDIETMRVGKIVQWYPQAVKIDLYNDRTGKHEEILMPKKSVAIIENPLYSVMNEPNSTLQRLIRKLNLLDYVDEQNGAGKLDMIIQLPYIIKTDARRQQAEQRRKDIEMQLEGSKYGIAYTDGTEKVMQLNRSIDSQLPSQIEYLTSMLYSQLGMTEDVMKGTADEKTMLNYYNRTIEPFLSAITTEFKRKFLSKTARTQNQSIEFFRDPFKLVPVNDIAQMADTFVRNAILSENEVRAILAFKPSEDPRADELQNPNLYPESESPMDEGYEESVPAEEDQEEERSLMDTPVSEITGE